MAFFMQVFNHILRITIGLIFIVSGLAKLYPIEPFEIIFVDLGIANWMTAPFLARSIISFELFLGLCIIFNSWMKNKLYIIAQASLIIFSIYLIYLLITEGNAVDCGCFGNLIALTPTQSLIKNLLLMVGLFFTSKYYHSTGLKWLPLLFLIGAFVATFSLNKVGLQNVQATELNKEIDLSGLPTIYKTSQQIDFNKGNKLVAFLSVKCKHCKNAAYKLAYFGKEKKVTNLYLVIAATNEKDIKPFLDETKLTYPVIWMNDDTFFNYSGGSLPAFIYVEDGVLKKKWIGELFKIEELEELLIFE
jgi:Methylamine utilisation protein MauE